METPLTIEYKDRLKSLGYTNMYECCYNRRLCNILSNKDIELELSEDILIYYRHIFELIREHDAIIVNGNLFPYYLFVEYAIRLNKDVFVPSDNAPKWSNLRKIHKLNLWKSAMETTDPFKELKYNNDWKEQDVLFSYNDNYYNEYMANVDYLDNKDDRRIEYDYEVVKSITWEKI